MLRMSAELLFLYCISSSSSSSSSRTWARRLLLKLTLFELIRTELLFFDLRRDSGEELVAFDDGSPLERDKEKREGAK